LAHRSCPASNKTGARELPQRQPSSAAALAARLPQRVCGRVTIVWHLESAQRANILACLLASLGFVLPRPAAAQGAACAPECPKGYACETSTQILERVPELMVTVNECKAVPCSSDQDCDQGLVCHEATCLPPRALPCGADSDCGEGFVCAELCTSTGFETPCTGAGEFSCFPRTRACTSHEECWPGWTCGRNPLAAVVVSPSGVERCQSPLPLTMCLPPYDWLFHYGAGGYWEWHLQKETGSRPEVVETPCTHSTPSDQDSGTDRPVALDPGPPSGCSLSPHRYASGANLFGLLTFVAALLVRRRGSRLEVEPSVRD